MRGISHKALDASTRRSSVPAFNALPALTWLARKGPRLASASSRESRWARRSAAQQGYCAWGTNRSHEVVTSPRNRRDVDLGLGAHAALANRGAMPLFCVSLRRRSALRIPLTLASSWSYQLALPVLGVLRWRCPRPLTSPRSTPCSRRCSRHRRRNVPGGDAATGRTRAVAPARRVAADAARGAAPARRVEPRRAAPRLRASSCGRIATGRSRCSPAYLRYGKPEPGQPAIVRMLIDVLGDAPRGRRSRSSG